MKKVLGLFTLAIVACFLASSCSSAKRSGAIKVGTIAGPETELMEAAKKVAKEKYNLDVEIVTFTDYAMPNEALNNGSIDANMFQHVPYLDAQIASRGYKIVNIGKGFVYPLGVYSKKIKSLEEIPLNGKFAVPNDPSNEARALLLLEKSGLIKLRPEAGANATVADITFNPKSLTISELDAAQLPRSLDDVDAATINNTYASTAGLKLSDSIFKEGSDSLYVNVLVVREKDKDDSRLKNILAAFQSKEVVAKAKELFGDGAVPSFTPIK